MADRFKACIHGRLLAGIAGSNPAGAWKLVFFKCCMFNRYRLLRRADLSPRGVIPIVVCLIVCDTEISTITLIIPVLGFCATGK